MSWFGLFFREAASSNYDGQLGDGTTTRRYNPGQVVDGSGDPVLGILAVSAGGSFSLALKTDGSLLAWGDNSDGRLGNGSIVNQHTPVSVVDALGNPITGIKAVSAGVNHSLALKTDGTVLAWGANYMGMLGDGTTTDRYNPVLVVTGSGVPITGVQAVYAGGQFSIALKTDGTLLSWGNNNSGRLGDGTTTERHNPVPVLASPGVPLTGIEAVAVGPASHVLAIQSGTGGMLAWGNNQYGQLGNGESGTGTSQSYPVAVVRNPLGDPATGFRAVSVGIDHSIALWTDLTFGDGVAGWGHNNYGQLGLGVTLDLVRPGILESSSYWLTPVNAAHLYSPLYIGGDGGCIEPITCIVDDDQDGYGTSLGTVVIAADGICDTAQGESATSDDCNDGDAGINPGATDIADDGIDQNCNGFDTVTCTVDGDQDGYGTSLGTTVLAADGTCDTAESESATSDDCNDGDATVYPGATEIADDGIDQDCSGSDTVTCTVDGDKDGYGTSLGTTVLAADGTCDTAEGESATSDDCNDGDAGINPGATDIADDGIDQDCSGSDTVTCIIDGDKDGYGIGLGTTVLAADGICDAAEGESTSSDDCNDGDATVYPGATEIADDGIDQDCNGFDTVTCTVDGDQDGYGTGLGTPVLAADGTCDTAQSESTSSDDCNDGDATVYPGATEIADDGIDQDCSGSDTITCIVDGDQDGYGTSLGTTVLATDGTCDAAEGESTSSDDCNDSNADEHPGQTWYQDSDVDGYGNPSVSLVQCAQPLDYILDNTDCNDSKADEHPGQTWYQDNDVDGYGNPFVSLVQCAQPTGYILDNTDCNDSNSAQSTCEDDDSDGIAAPVDGYMDNSSFVDESSSPSINFTDIPDGGVTYGSISDRADLTLAIGDSEIDGVSISAKGGTGVAMIRLCDFDLAVTSGDYCVATCGSLILDVVSGPMEVYLNTTGYVAVPTGVTAKITEISNGTFTVENKSGAGSLFVYVDGKEMEVKPGEQTVIQISFPWNMFLPAITGDRLRR